MGLIIVIRVLSRVVLTGKASLQIPILSPQKKHSHNNRSSKNISFLTFSFLNLIFCMKHLLSFILIVVHIYNKIHIHICTYNIIATSSLSLIISYYIVNILLASTTCMDVSLIHCEKLGMYVFFTNTVRQLWTLYYTIYMIF